MPSSESSGSGSSGEDKVSTPTSLKSGGSGGSGSGSALHHSRSNPHVVQGSDEEDIIFSHPAPPSRSSRRGSMVQQQHNSNGSSSSSGNNNATPTSPILVNATSPPPNHTSGSGARSPPPVGGTVLIPTTTSETGSIKSSEEDHTNNNNRGGGGGVARENSVGSNNSGTPHTLQLSQEGGNLAFPGVASGSLTTPRHHHLENIIGMQVDAYSVQGDGENNNNNNDNNSESATEGEGKGRNGGGDENKHLLVQASKDPIRSVVRLSLQAGIIPFAFISIPIVAIAALSIAQNEKSTSVVVTTGCSAHNESTYVVLGFSAVIFLMWLIEFIYLFATSSFLSAGETTSHKDLLSGLLIATHVCLCVIAAFLDSTFQRPIIVYQIFTLLLGVFSSKDSQEKSASATSSSSSSSCCHFNVFQWIHLPIAVIGVAVHLLAPFSAPCLLPASPELLFVLFAFAVVIMIFTSVLVGRIYSILGLASDAVVAQHVSRALTRFDIRLARNFLPEHISAAIQQSHGGGGGAAAVAEGGGGVSHDASLSVGVSVRAIPPTKAEAEQEDEKSKDKKKKLATETIKMKNEYVSETILNISALVIVCERLKQHIPDWLIGENLLLLQGVDAYVAAQEAASGIGGAGADGQNNNNNNNGSPNNNNNRRRKSNLFSSLGGTNPYIATGFSRQDSATESDLNMNSISDSKGSMSREGSSINLFKHPSSTASDLDALEQERSSNNVFGGMNQQVAASSTNSSCVISSAAGSSSGGSSSKKVEAKISVVAVYYLVDREAPTPEYSEHRFSERVHHTARTLHGVVHHFVGGFAIVTFNAVSRTAATESKAARFLHTLATYSGDPHIQACGASYTGRARCHVVGDRKKAVVLTADWWPVFMHLAGVAKTRNSMIIDGATKTAIFTEYNLRAYGTFAFKKVSPAASSSSSLDHHDSHSSLSGPSTPINHGGGSTYRISSFCNDSSRRGSTLLGTIAAGGAEQSQQQRQASARQQLAGCQLVQTFELLTERQTENVEWLSMFQMAREGRADDDAKVQAAAGNKQRKSSVAALTGGEENSAEEGSGGFPRKDASNVSEITSKSENLSRKGSQLLGDATASAGGSGKEEALDIDAMSCVALELASTFNDEEAKHILQRAIRSQEKNTQESIKLTVEQCKVMLDRLNEQSFAVLVEYA